MWVAPLPVPSRRRVLLTVPGPGRPVGLEVLDRPVGGAPERAGLAVELDCQCVLGDVDANDAAGVDAPERDGLAADGDHAGRADAPLNGHWLSARPRQRASRPAG